MHKYTFLILSIFKTILVYQNSKRASICIRVLRTIQEFGYKLTYLNTLYINCFWHARILRQNAVCKIISYHPCCPTNSSTWSKYQFLYRHKWFYAVIWLLRQTSFYIVICQYEINLTHIVYYIWKFL